MVILPQKYKWLNLKSKLFLFITMNIRLRGIKASRNFTAIPYWTAIHLHLSVYSFRLGRHHWYVSPSSASLCVSSPPLSCFLCPGWLSWPPLPRWGEATEERKPEPQILMPWYLIHRHNGTPRYNVMQMERERSWVEGAFLNMKTKRCCQILLLHPGSIFFLL